MAERHDEMERLRNEVPEDACNYGWYVSPPRSRLYYRIPKWLRYRLPRRSLLDRLYPEVCGESPAEPTDAPLALKYDITRVCEKHARNVVLQEQIQSAMRASDESKAWLVRNGHTAPTYQDMFGDD